MVEDLMRKDFVAFAGFDDAEVFRADFLQRYADTIRSAKSFMAFLTKGVGLPW